MLKLVLILLKESDTSVSGCFDTSWYNSIMTTHEKTNKVAPFTAKEIQEEFVKYVYEISCYWNNVLELKESPNDLYSTWISILNGFVHSFHVTCTGCAMGFPISYDMNVVPRDKSVPTVDINDGGLQYTRIDMIDEALNELANLREDQVEEKYRLLWHIKLTEIKTAVGSLEIPSSEKTFRFVSNLLDFIEQGDENFDHIDFVAVPHPDDKEYNISRGECYYEDSTTFTGLTPSLGELYRNMLSK